MDDAAGITTEAMKTEAVWREDDQYSYARLLERMTRDGRSVSEIASELSLERLEDDSTECVVIPGYCVYDGHYEAYYPAAKTHDDAIGWYQDEDWDNDFEVCVRVFRIGLELDDNGKWTDVRLEDEEGVVACVGGVNLSDSKNKS